MSWGWCEGTRKSCCGCSPGIQAAALGHIYHVTVTAVCIQGRVKIDTRVTVNERSSASVHSDDAGRAASGLGYVCSFDRDISVPRECGRADRHLAPLPRTPTPPRGQQAHCPSLCQINACHSLATDGRSACQLFCKHTGGYWRGRARARAHETPGKPLVSCLSMGINLPCYNIPLMGNQ